MDVPKWKYEKNFEGLFFLAQRMQEIVFDYTLDTFKAPALNSSAICFEAIQIIGEIEENKMRVNTLQPILDELKWKLQNDLVTKSILKDDLNLYINFPDLIKYKDIKLKLELLYLKISNEKYIRKCEELLIELVPKNTEKRDIDKIATNYISALLEIGYSQGYIFKMITEFFFYPVNVESVSNLTSFFKIFTAKKKKFTVYFTGSVIFKEISSTAANYQLKIIDAFELSKEDECQQLKKYFPLNYDDVYIKASDIVAYDALAARNISFALINKVSKLFVFYHHKEHPEWSNDVFVIDKDGQGSIVKEPTSPMKKNKDLKPIKAAYKLQETLSVFKLEKRSFKRFNRAIDLHGLSIENNNTENQLLQNWIALETLLVENENNSKIDQVINSLLPFLSYKYIENQFLYVLQDVSRFDKFGLLKILKTVEKGTNVIEKFMMSIVLPEYKEHGMKILGLLEENPLLRFRIFLFNKYFSSPKEIQNYLKTHQQKVVWQIKRIYRTRNQIVHSGRSPRFLAILVENSHVYLDKLLETIIHLQVDEKQIEKIEHAVAEIAIRTGNQSTKLKAMKEKVISYDDFKVIF